MSSKKRERRRLAKELWESGDWGSAPIAEANRWLITGPNTMPKQERRDLHRLIDFHRFARQGTLEPKHTRAFWLGIADRDYFGSYWMKQTYHVNRITQIAIKGHPFLALIAKGSHFGGAP